MVYPKSTLPLVFDRFGWELGEPIENPAISLSPFKNLSQSAHPRICMNPRVSKVVVWYRI